MFEQSEALPSNYGYEGGDPSSLSSLAPGGGALPSSYGETKDASGAASQPAPSSKKSLKDYAAASQAAADTAAGAFVRGVTGGLQQSSVFQGSGKASTPSVPEEDTTAKNKGSNWKLYAALGATTLLVGGAVWYFTRNREK